MSVIIGGFDVGYSTSRAVFRRDAHAARDVSFLARSNSCDSIVYLCEIDGVPDFEYITDVDRRPENCATAFKDAKTFIGRVNCDGTLPYFIIIFVMHHNIVLKLLYLQVAHHQRAWCLKPPSKECFLSLRLSMAKG